MSKRTILALLITAMGGCAAADEPWTPTSSSIRGADIPSVLVEPAATYAPSHSIADLPSAQADFARAIDGAFDAKANGMLEAEELVAAEQSIDFADAQEDLAKLWELLKQFP
jgi:hypothetical protein